jgi:hypothetical protein
MGGVEARRSRRMARELAPAVGVLLGAWLLMGLAQGIPSICLLAHPCPAPDARVAPALSFGGLMLVPVVVLLLASLAGRPRGRWLRVACYVMLLALAVVGLGAVLFSGGFTVPTFGLRL